MGILMYYWWESTLLQPLWKTVQRFLKKLKIELPYNTTISLLGIYLKGKNSNSKRYEHHHVPHSITSNSQDMEAN